MYKIYRSRNTLPKSLTTTFISYERARQAVRKWLRSAKKLQGNAAITDFGFSIQRVT